MRMTRGGNAGFTIIEVVIAAFFLALTTVMATQLLATAERIRGRGRAISYAEIVASGEVERLRSQASRLVVPEDTVYDETMNGMPFTVVRRIVPKMPVVVRRDTLDESSEYALAVMKKTSGDTLLRLRLLQGREK